MTEPLIPESLAELQRLLAHGAVLPWALHPADSSTVINPDGWVVANCLLGDSPNAALIVAAVNALPALLNAAEERDAIKSKEYNS